MEYYLAKGEFIFLIYFLQIIAYFSAKLRSKNANNYSTFLENIKLH